MLAKEARQKIHLSKNSLSDQLDRMKDTIEIKHFWTSLSQLAISPNIMEREVYNSTHPMVTIRIYNAKEKRV